MTTEAIDELETFFNGIEIPKEIQIYPGVKMLDAPKTIKQYLEHCRTTKPGLYTTEPRFNDLIHLQKMLSA
jgi:hypothetical protein